MADGRREASPGPVSVFASPPQRSTPPQKSWLSHADRGKRGAATLLRTRGRAHYVELGKLSGAARRAKEKPPKKVCIAKASLTTEEAMLLQKISRRLGVTQAAVVRSCLMAGLAALGEE